MLKTCGRAAAAACATLLAAVPASAATTWTEVPSGTTAEITAIDYQSEARAWFATSDGRVFRADGGGFAQAAGTLPGAVYTGIAFQPGGSVGVAVTADGRAQRSTDGGASWDTVTVLQTHRSCSDGTLTGVRRLSSVFWADPSTVYYVGGGGSGNQPVVLRDTLPIGTADDVNTIAPGGGCRVGDQTDGVTDGFGAPGVLRFVTDDFGGLWASSDALATPASLLADMTIGSGGVPRLAVDPANASRAWVTSTNGGLTYLAPGPSRRPVVRAADGLPVSDLLHDVGTAGGTVVAAGDGGAILTSLDGTTAHRQPAPGALAGVDWRAVGIADAGHAMVGGAGGALVRTANANALPDPPPPPPGPTPVDPGPAAPSPAEPAPSDPRPSARAPRPGAAAGTPRNVSGRPASAATGGARLTAWRRVALRRGRFVPVRVSARSPRRFVVEIRRAKRPHRRVAMAKARLRAPGRKLVKVPLRRSVRTGRYRLVVRVYKGRRQIGRRVTIAFVIVR